MGDVERLREENERLYERLVETQMLAHKWMVAHDKLAAGKPYDYPKPADVPECVAENERLRDALEQLEGKARLGGDCLGNSPPNFKSCQQSFYLLADLARAALAKDRLSALPGSEK
jgi:hypothetical protein